MQKIHLSIPEPCHENWQTMAPTDKGKYCHGCAKEVIDFSMMTDTEMLNYFGSLTNEKVCGRVLPSQLNRNIIKPRQPKKRLFWYWNYIVMFLMFFGKANNAKAQGQVYKTMQMVRVKADEVRGEISTIPDSKKENRRIVIGKVRDKDGNPVSFATIKVKGAKLGLSADANGAYSIRVSSKTVLEISAQSFNDIEVVVGNQTILSTILTKADPSKLREVIVTMAICTKRPELESDAVKDEDLSSKVAGAKLRSTAIGRLGSETHVRMGSISPIEKNSRAIYVVDDVIMPSGADVNPDDVEDYRVLQTHEAVVLFGPDGVNGAIVINTRKARELALDTVTVSSEFGSSKIAGMLGGIYISGIKVEQENEIITSKVTDNSVKIFPNPVFSGNAITISLNFKRAGLHQIQIVDGNGRTVLYKRINAFNKTQNEVINIDSRWSAGIYYLSVIDSKNKLVNKNSFIIQ